jgi:hypothetical protein
MSTQGPKLNFDQTLKTAFFVLLIILSWKQSLIEM